MNNVVTETTYTYDELTEANSACTIKNHESVAFKLIDEAIYGYYNLNKPEIEVTIKEEISDLTDTYRLADVVIDWNYHNSLSGHIMYRYHYNPEDKNTLVPVTAVSVLNIPGDGCYVTAYQMHYCAYFMHVLSLRPTFYEIPVDKMLPVE